VAGPTSGETRAYIRDFNQAVASTSTAMDFYQKMLALHPNRVNPGSLWKTANALKPNARVGRHHHPKGDVYVRYLADRSHPDIVRRQGKREYFHIAPGG
jgi:hypothetical protein